MVQECENSHPTTWTNWSKFENSCNFPKHTSGESRPSFSIVEHSYDVTMFRKHIFIRCKAKFADGLHIHAERKHCENSDSEHVFGVNCETWCRPARLGASTSTEFSAMVRDWFTRVMSWSPALAAAQNMIKKNKFTQWRHLTLQVDSWHCHNEFKLNNPPDNVPYETMLACGANAASVQTIRDSKSSTQELKSADCQWTSVLRLTLKCFKKLRHEGEFPDEVQMWVQPKCWQTKQPTHGWSLLQKLNRGYFEPDFDGFWGKGLQRLAECSGSRARF